MRNGIRLAYGIAVRLGKLDPGNQARYLEGYKAYAKQILVTARVVDGATARILDANTLPELFRKPPDDKDPAVIARRGAY